MNHEIVAVVADATQGITRLVLVCSCGAMFIADATSAIERRANNARAHVARAHGGNSDTEG